MRRETRVLVPGLKTEELIAGNVLRKNLAAALARKGRLDTTTGP